MANTQLSLFDTSVAAETTYKVGDFVKLRRKSAHAAYLKKGDIIQIEAIHPATEPANFGTSALSPGDMSIQMNLP